MVPDRRSDDEPKPFDRQERYDMSQTTATVATTTETDAQTATAEVIVYSTTWCPDCHRAKAFLTSRGETYREIDIEAEPEAATIVAAHNDGKHVVPTFAIDGGYYGNPSITELKALLDARP